MLTEKVQLLPTEKEAQLVEKLVNQNSHSQLLFATTHVKPVMAQTHQTVPNVRQLKEEF